jgi:hypothetical protein
MSIEKKIHIKTLSKAIKPGLRHPRLGLGTVLLQNGGVHRDTRALVTCRTSSTYRLNGLLEQLILRVVVLRTTHDVGDDSAVVRSSSSVLTRRGEFVSLVVGAGSCGGHLSEEECS